jgi:hypothetical protein
LYKVLRSVFEFLKKEEAAFQISVPEPKPEPSPEEKAAKAAKDREYYAKQDTEQAQLYRSLWDKYKVK